VLDIILTIALIIILIIIILFATPITLLSWHSRKQPPSYGLIECKYYVCRQHKILQGGIFGKGLTKKYYADEGKCWCWRDEWEEIDRKTFKELATDWYGVNWSEETLWWQDDYDS